MLTAVYYMLRDGVTYRELGETFFDRRDPHQAVARLTSELGSVSF